MSIRKFGDEFPDGFFDGRRCPFLIDLTGHDLPKSLPQVFKPNVFVFNHGGQMVQKQPASRLVRSPYVGDIKVHTGFVRSEKLFDRLTLLVCPIDLMTVFHFEILSSTVIPIRKLPLPTLLSSTSFQGDRMG